VLGREEDRNGSLKPLTEKAPRARQKLLKISLNGNRKYTCGEPSLEKTLRQRPGREEQKVQFRDDKKPSTKKSGTIFWRAQQQDRLHEGEVKYTTGGGD